MVRGAKDEEETTHEKVVYQGRGEGKWATHKGGANLQNHGEQGNNKMAPEGKHNGETLEREITQKQEYDKLKWKVKNWEKGPLITRVPWAQIQSKTNRSPNPFLSPNKF